MRRNIMQLRAKAAVAASALVLAAGLGFGAGMAQADQPHMQSALGDLRAARAELEAALPNKGGHRVNAIGLVDQAIGEVRAGIAVGNE
jgi:hypothetical protein